MTTYDTLNLMDDARNLVQRFSSRRQRLDKSFLADRLDGALAYNRIAGYFSSSILEIAGEQLETVAGAIRVICNSGLHPTDVQTAKAAQAALRQEWCGSEPENRVEVGGKQAKSRFGRLYRFLTQRAADGNPKLEVRVLPDEHFGLVHGKAGVITLADGSKTAFLGSVNESKSAWTLNYELVWEDQSPEAVDWVQQEFDALWGSPFAVPLAEFVIQDVERISRRQVIDDVSDWREGEEAAEPDPAPVFVESPVYRREVGLWEHQKHFVKLAFDAHREQPGGARFVLADQVGLGKTIQLAMSAQLMALCGDKPVLVIAPKTLLWQWQAELKDLLDMPSAVWDGRRWVDENDIEYPAVGPEGIRACPRRVGMVSNGLIFRRSEAAQHLLSLNYECVIVDESHRARRRNLGQDKEGDRPDPNNLLRFLYDISTLTKSMLLATATPVQLYPVEAWDLLDVLSRGSEAVLGNAWSRWKTRVAEGLGLVMGREPLPDDDAEIWEWVRSPFPPRSEHRDFEMLRRSLDMSDDLFTAKGDAYQKLRPPDRQRLKSLFPRFIEQHNPFIRHIVRRSRRYLEETHDPETNEPYLKPIDLVLWGERDEDAIRLPPYLREAYDIAEHFCQELGRRMLGAGFLKTLLLRRVGSSIAAGRATADKMLRSWEDVDTPEYDEDEDLKGEEEDVVQQEAMSKSLTATERGLLERFVEALEANQERDPKYAVVLDCLSDKRWLNRGCIIFSQFFDSVDWLAKQLIEDLPGETVAVYAGAGKSGIYEDGLFSRCEREEIKTAVRQGRIRLLVGTDAASEGLNLQRLGTLINLDLPWNPTRLEQRKGRIQRIGQLNDSVDIYNMRYLDSVEDRVHALLSTRLESIFTLFGQVPDVLEDVWVDVALGQTERAKQIIDAVPHEHPFVTKYQNIVRNDWDSCERVLSAVARKRHLCRGW